MLHSVEEAIDFFSTNPELDLIFSDIELGDGLSFEIFEKVNNRIPIIFALPLMNMPFTLSKLLELIIY